MFANERFNIITLRLLLFITLINLPDEIANFTAHFINERAVIFQIDKPAADDIRIFDELTAVSRQGHDDDDHTFLRQ